MKKNLLSVIALVCAAAALAVSIYTCVSLNALVKAQNAQIDALLAAADTPEAPTESAGISILSWKLEPQVREEGTGADVHFTAMPDGSFTGAQLKVQLMGEPYGTYPCQWDGQTLTATADVEIENGYAYTLLVTAADGTVTELPLTSPDDPTDPVAVNLMDSLSFYSNLLVDSWVFENSTLTVTGGYVQVQLPLLGGGTGSGATAVLSLRLNGQILGSQSLELVPGEGSGSQEAQLQNAAFPLEGLGEGDQVELWLEVSIGSQTDSLCGASWYLENGELLLTAG